jgi:ribosomal-protein-alanine N-acetyltransferase
MEFRQPVSIREVNQADLGAVFAIEHKCFPDPYPMSLLNKLRSMYSDTFLVAEHNGGIVGYVIGAVRWRNVGHVLAIGVDPPYRKRGIGSALMREAIGCFLRKGAKVVRLEVRKSNVGAQEFYRKLGFVERFEVPYYYGDGESAVTMELTL